MKLRRLVLPLSVLLLLYGAPSIYAQNLTVREIMAEPSIAGMRVEGEKLSPDGSKVIFLWNAEGKMPRDLYLVSSSGGTPQKILSVSDLPVPTRTPEKENKLDYGLTVRDDFVKERENQLGGFEWSPNSRALVFSYAGDLYLFAVHEAVRPNGATPSENAWKTLVAAIRRRADLIPNIIDVLRKQGIREDELIQKINNAKGQLISALEAQTSDRIDPSLILDRDKEINNSLQTLLRLQENYPQLRSNDLYSGLLNELNGTTNRVNVALQDYKFSLVDRRITRLTQTQVAEVGPRFLDNDRILYSQNGNLFVSNLTNNLVTQISKEADQQKFISISSPTPNKVGTLVAYVVSDNSKQRALAVPNYLDEFVQASNVRRGWSEQKVMVTVTDGSRDTAFEVKLPKAEGVSNIRGMKWAADGSSLIVDRVDKDTKRRQLFYVHDVGSKGEQIILVTEETDDKWQAPLSSIFEPNPKDDSELFFASERDGFNHLYLAKLERLKPEPNPTGVIRGENPSDGGFSSNVKITQLTKGNWQVEWAKWLQDGRGVIYSSTTGDTSQRKFFTVSSIDGAYRQLFPILGGMQSNPQLDEESPNPVLLWSRSEWNQPDDLWAQNVCPDCAKSGNLRRLTHTVPPAFSERTWNEPKFIDIPSRDGKQIESKIYLPAGFSQKQKYPMVIFVHGAGYLQNVINGWNNYYREFMFNELLTQKGYVVLDIDYRGSAGYGREWRTDVYDFLGGKDYDDHIDAIDYMIRNYGVDPKRVGVYGGSYGGFMVEMLAFRAPEKIAAAAALRPVADWKNYYAASPGYTAQRLGFPDKNPEAYKRSSPISYADGLKTHLLILHGMSDDNVHVQDSVQLIEKLVRLGKTQYFETMLYPSENHGFARPESWTDEYERILAFFEKHLK